MHKFKPVYKVILMLLVVALIYNLTTLKFEHKPSTIMKVRIDSISMSLRYQVLPENVWYYYTKYGSFSSPNQIYNVGDSVKFEVIRLKK
jgi:hypothetical protein